MPDISHENLAPILSARLVAFVRLARKNGFCIGVAEEIDAQRVALHCDITEFRRLRWGLRSLLCSNQDDWQRFDQLYDAYWYDKKANRTQPSDGAPVQTNTENLAGNQSAANKATEADQAQQGDGEDASNEGSREGASACENQMKADFQFIVDSAQMRSVEQLVERLARKMRRRLVRRQKIQHHGRKINLRRTLRNCLRFGGVPLKLEYQHRIRRQPRLILIVDVSRSMSIYSTVFLRFARGIVNVFRDADAFAYHTKLVPISDALRQTDMSKMRESLALISMGWSGGTRIGECLASLNENYSQRLNSRSVVMVVSDGLDTGEPTLLTQELAKIKQRVRRLVWLNPLLGRDGYEPKTASMQAALPLIDLFAPAHNLESLQALESYLVTL